MNPEQYNHEEPPTFTPSHLFSLEPIAIHQPEVESLTSYITRLAGEHRLTIHDLIAHVIHPLVQEQQLPTIGELKRSSTGSVWLKSLSNTLNSLNDVTSEWISVIEALTHQSNLSDLTMLPYHGVISSRELVKPFAAWCPDCYEEQRIGNQPIYDPLIWKIDVVQICLRHRRRLEVSCPYSDCGRKIRNIYSNSLLGYCPYCTRWLGINSGSPDTEFLDTDFTTHEHIYSKIGEMLAESQSTHHIKANNFTIAVRRTIDELLGGNGRALARILDMSHRSIYDLRDGVQTPRLATVLKLCQLINLTPLQLLTCDLDDLNLYLSETSLTLPKVQQKGHRVFDATAIGDLLRRELANNAIPPSSLMATSKKLGYDQSFLAKYLPVECDAISERYKNFRSQQTFERIQRECDILRQEAISLHERGIYPSQRRLCQAIPRGLWKNKTIREAHVKLLQELGYRK